MLTPDMAYGRLLDVSGALMLLVVLAMLLERALAVVFEYHWFRRLSDRVPGLKAPFALLVSWQVCGHVGYDILACLFAPSGSAAEPTPLGVLVTSAVVAGGSAGAMTLFQGVLGFGRAARLAMIELNRVRTEALVAEARARRERAASQDAPEGRTASADVAPASGNPRKVRPVPGGLG
jgi:hypothetical protein